MQLGCKALYAAVAAVIAAAVCCCQRGYSCSCRCHRGSASAGPSGAEYPGLPRGHEIYGGPGGQRVYLIQVELQGMSASRNARCNIQILPQRYS